MKGIYILLLMMPLACTRSSLQKDTVISDLTFSAKTIPADGNSTLTISVTINSQADSTKRNVLFSASDGSFVNGKDSSISQKAAYNNGQLVAQVTYVAPVHAGKIYFVVKPDLGLTYYDLSLRDSVMATPSLPAKIKLSASSFGVRFGFQGEDTLTAKLSNSSGSGVTTGVKVLFDDSLPGFQGVHGRFRATSATSNANSQVSTIYSPGFIAPVGTDLYIRVSVQNSSGSPIRDSVLLSIIQ